MRNRMVSVLSDVAASSSRVELGNAVGSQDLLNRCMAADELGIEALFQSLIALPNADSDIEVKGKIGLVGITLYRSDLERNG
jgi:hypothetical protein